MTRTISLALTVVAVSLIAACGSPGGSGPEPEPDAGGDEPVVETPCIVGTWQLDVADYAAQSEAFVLGLGVPIEGFAMTGTGTIQFTADGLVATDIALTSTGTIVAGDVRVPFSTPSAYTGSGDWSDPGDGETIDLANWATVPASDVAVDPAAPEVPAIDYTDIPTVTATCTADSLVLQGPGAPLAAVWTR